MKYIKQILPDVVAVVFFLAVAVVCFMGPVSEGLVLGGHDSVAAVGQGKELSDYSARTGETSRWSSRMFGGMPTYQMSPSYDSSSVLSKIERVYDLGTTGVVAYIFALLLGFYILLRAFNFKPWLSALGAILWAFSSYFFIIISAGHIWKVITLAFIPPTLAGMVLCYRGKYLWGGAVAALFTALQIKSNHVQMSYYFLFLMALVCLAYLVYALRPKKNNDEETEKLWGKATLANWLKATGVLLVAGMLGVAANVSNLYHTYTYSMQSLRGPSELSAEAGKEEMKTDGGLDRDYITQWSYGIDETLTLLIPDFRGGGSGENLLENPNVEDTEECYAFTSQFRAPGVPSYWGDQPMTVGPVYVGAFVCFLFVLGLFFVRGPWKWALAAGTVLSLLFAWGHNDAWFTNWCIDHLPMYNKFRTPSSALVVAELTMPLLAILCLARILRRPADLLGTKRGVVGLSVAFVLTAGLCLLFWLVPSMGGSGISAQEAEALGQNAQMQPAYDLIRSMRLAALSGSARRSFLIILVGAALLLGYVKLAKNTTSRDGYFSFPEILLCAALGLLCALDLYFVNHRYLNDDSFTDPVELQDVKPWAADEVVLQDKGDFRVLNIAEGSPFNETSNHTAYFHQSVGGYSAAKLHRVQDLFDRKMGGEITNFVGQINETMGDLSKINADTIAPVLNMMNAKYIIFGKNANQVVENPYANGNGWFVGSLNFVKGADAEMAAMQTLDTKHAAVSDEEFRNVLDGTPLDSGRVELVSRDANAVAYNVSTPKGGVCVLSEVYYPGWTATLDGQPVEVGRVNYLLRAVKVPAGSHKLEMQFKPASVQTTERVAFVAMGLVLLAFIGALVLQGRKLFRKETPNQNPQPTQQKK